MESSPFAWSKKQNSHLEKKSYSEPQKVIDDKSVKHYLQNFHDKFVITPTDIANNNFSIVCLTFYIECLLKELNIREELKGKTKKTNSTYKWLKSKPSAIINRHAKYMKNHKIALAESQKSLPFLYWIPKMHKKPSKQRYIAASHTCSTKPLSKMITFCLKLIQTTENTWFQQKLDCQQFSWSFKRNHPVRQTHKN